MITHDEWLKAHKFEAEWWGDCLNTYGEETKQLTYAEKMGLFVNYRDRRPFIDLDGKSVLDIGGSADSMLLKTVNRGNCLVVDPIPIPQWCIDRYTMGNIGFKQQMAEETLSFSNDKSEQVPFIFDEVWIYNVLQHVQDPQKILENAKAVGKLIRIFEWVDVPPHDGHPQELKEDKLNEWLGGKGHVEYLDRKIWTGYCKAYYGMFPTKHFGEVKKQ